MRDLKHVRMVSKEAVRLNRKNIAENHRNGSSIDLF